MEGDEPYPSQNIAYCGDDTWDTHLKLVLTNKAL